VRAGGSRRAIRGRPGRIVPTGLRKLLENKRDLFRHLGAFSTFRHPPDCLLRREKWRLKSHRRWVLASPDSNTSLVYS